MDAVCGCGCGGHHHHDHDDYGPVGIEEVVPEPVEVVSPLDIGPAGGAGGVLYGPGDEVVKVVVPLNGEDMPYLDGGDVPLLDMVGEPLDTDLPVGRRVDRSDVAGWPEPAEPDGGVRTMIALRVPPKVGGRYGRDAEGLVDLEPLQNRHITLLHMGRPSPEERARLHDTLRRWLAAGQWQPMEGRAQGWGTFTKASGDGRGVLWMGWNIPGLAELRQDLAETLRGEGFEWSTDYDFTPHETVGYSDGPVQFLPTFPDPVPDHTFDAILIGEDDEWTEYPFHTGLLLASGRVAIVAALEAAADEELAGLSDEELDALVAGGGLDRNRGNAERLRRFWTVGPGGVRIRWGTKGDWERCVKHLSKHLGPRAKGYCQLRHKEMTGMHTGDMEHRILFGWGGKPGSYWAKKAAKKAVKASAGFPMVFGMDDGSVVVPLSDDPSDPLVRLLRGVPEEPAAPVEFRIPLLLPEGVESGDGRTFEKGAVDIRETPIPLLWQPNSMQGHDGAVIVGRIDRVERTDDGIGNCHGVFDTSPMALEAVRMIRDGFLRGVSADLDKFEAKIIGKGGGTATAGKRSTKGKPGKDDDVVAPEKMNIKQGRVMAATLVAKPAFEQVKIELLEGGGPVSDQVRSDDGALVPDEGQGLVASGDRLPDGVYRGSLAGEVRASAVRFVTRLRREGRDPSAAAFTALTASGGFQVPLAPPAAWFEDPKLSKPTHLTITDDGRVFGHIAAWNVDHIGMGFGTRPPKSKSGYSYFRTGLLRTAEGNDVRVGQLTLTGGHAPLQADARQAVRHYDDTSSAFADVVAGEDRHGIWVAGALRPGVTETQLRTARASSPSGDWRPINGRLELVAVCQVNVPGFPVVEARVASGAVEALVAAGAAPLIMDMVSGVDPDAGDAGITDEESLVAAVEEFGCGTGQRSRKRIAQRARELAMEDLLPEDWDEEPEGDTVDGAESEVWDDDDTEAAAQDVDDEVLEEIVEGLAEEVEEGLAEGEEPEDIMRDIVGEITEEEADAVTASAELESAFLSAKSRMLRAKVMPVMTAAVEGPDGDAPSLADAVQGMTIREAAEWLFAATAGHPDEVRRDEVAALVASVRRGEALSDGTWLIRNEKDLMRAVDSFGSIDGSRDRRIVKNHIKRRARDLGAFQYVPPWWWTEREVTALQAVIAEGEAVAAADGAVESVTAAAADDAAVFSKQPVSKERREEMAKEHTAMPDGSYPIADTADLKRAIKAYGRAKESDRAKVRRHIMRRARALGHADLIPDSWKK